MDSFITREAALLAQMISLWILVVCQEQAQASAYLSVEEHRGGPQGRGRSPEPQPGSKNLSWKFSP